MARDPPPAGQGSQGWQFWSMGVDDTAGPANNHNEVGSATTSTQVQTKAHPKEAQQDDPQVQIPIPSSDGVMKKDGWQFWALGDHQTKSNNENDEQQPSTSFSAPTTDDGSPATFATNATTTTTISKKKKGGWKYWAIGAAEENGNNNSNNNDNVDPADVVLFSDENLHSDKPAVELLKSQEPQDDSRDECAWRYWSQMHQQQQQHRDEDEDEPRKKRSSEFDKEAWQFWAIGVSDNASQISLLTEGFEMDPTPMVKIVKIKKLQPIEPLDEIGWRYWSSMKKDAAAAAALKSNNETTNTKQGWQFWAIGGGKNKASSMDQEFIASERYEVDQPCTPIVKPVAPNVTESPNESAAGWRYWSSSNNVIVPMTTEENVGMAASSSSKQGWQFWAIGGGGSSSTSHHQYSKGHVPLTGLESDLSSLVKTKSRRNRHVESTIDKSGWRYWSSQIGTNEEGAETLTSVNMGKKQGWQYWALGVSNPSTAVVMDHKSSLLSEDRAAVRDSIESLATTTTSTNSREPAEESSSLSFSFQSETGGWRYWSRMKEDNHYEDLLQRDDHDSMSFISPFPVVHDYSPGSTNKRTKFTANPKFYSLKCPHSLTRIEEEERASKDGLEQGFVDSPSSSKDEDDEPTPKTDDSSTPKKNIIPKGGGIFNLKNLKKVTLLLVSSLVGLIFLGKQDVLLLTGI